MKSSLHSVLLALATLVTVLLGLGVVTITSFWPSFLLLIFFQTSAAATSSSLVLYAVACAIANMMHLYKLYTDAHHVAVYQFLWLPLRRLLVPIIMWVASIQSIREGTPTLYRKLENDDDLVMSRGVHRRYRKMKEIFQLSGLRHEIVYSDESGLTFFQFLPILWEHQRRICPNDAVGEFVKRFLVVSLMPDGIFDLYFDDDNNQQLVAFQFSMLQSPPSVLHWFMYFCKDSYTDKGLWFHGIRLALERGKALAKETEGVVCVNAQCHQTSSKQNAGFKPAEHTNIDLLSELYPFSWSTTIPQDVAKLQIWTD